MDKKRYSNKMYEEWETSYIKCVGIYKINNINCDKDGETSFTK